MAKKIFIKILIFFSMKNIFKLKKEKTEGVTSTGVEDVDSSIDSSKKLKIWKIVALVICVVGFCIGVFDWNTLQSFCDSILGL